MSPFLKIFSSSFLVIALIGVFNFIIDPYGIYNAVHIDGFNVPKVEVVSHEKFAKAYLAASIKPDIIAMGTSRVGYGINPESKNWVGEGVKFNLSIAGEGIYALRRFVEHVVAIHPPKQILFGLDFFSFNAKHKIPTNSSEALLAISADGVVNKSFKKHLFLSSIFSYSVTQSSVETIKKSRDNFMNTISSKTGMQQFFINGDDYLADDLMDIAVTDELPGAVHNFSVSVRYFMNEQYLIGKNKGYSFEDKNTSNSTLQDFRRLVSLCRDNNIEIYFYISPIHAAMQEAIRAIGLWPVYEQWKREMVWILEDEYGVDGYKLWDFSGYNSITTADIVDGRMREYIDPSHYTPVVGDMILSKIFNVNTDRLPLDFGKKINSKNIDKVIALILEEQQRYHITHANEVHEVDKAAAELGMRAEDVILMGGDRPNGVILGRQP